MIMNILTKTLATIPIIALSILIILWTASSWNRETMNLLWNNGYTTAFTYLFIASILLFIVMAAIVLTIVTMIWTKDTDN